MQHRGEHRGHALEHRDAVTLHDRQRRGRVEPRDQHQARTGGDRRVEAGGLPEGMGQRQRAEDHLARPEREHVHDDLGVAAQARVRELGTLGRPRGAGRVEDDRGVVVVARDGLGQLLGLVERRLELPGRSDDALGPRRLGAGSGRSGERMPGNHRAHLRIGQAEPGLALLESIGTTTPPARRTPS